MSKFMRRSIELNSESIAIKGQGWLGEQTPMGMIRSLESVNVRKRSSPQRRALREHLPPECLCRSPTRLHLGGNYPT